ncbi:hypothetical protein NADFUDRAFT_71234 [Nadsonia fulvescens var. elongata DSM 6958]|uniref:Uncharacterized protein n=1 Tax=Nadsonia fulvescens var. elongata DSM 6958 TaxID=857566 RepID=A0A1E3PFF6_9ASCO|nr:hypothetical protein NADFUDRAFT_71234 [Nadsonia fulvescens var. elongata DSM 6958]
MPELLAQFPENGLEFITSTTDSQPSTLFLEQVRFKQHPASILATLPSVKDYTYWVLIGQAAVFQKMTRNF